MRTHSSAIPAALAAALAVAVISVLAMMGAGGPRFPGYSQPAAAEGAVPGGNSAAITSGDPLQPVVTQPDGCQLDITKSATPDVVPLGGEIHYVIRIYNDGDEDCTSVVVTDPAPTDTECELISSSCPLGVECPDFAGCDTDSASWTLRGPLPPGYEVGAYMTVRLTAGAVKGEQIVNEACLTAEGVPEECALVTTDVGGPPGSISGLVTDNGGAPLEGCEVAAHPSQGGGTWGHTTTDADGLYTIAGLGPDTYQVLVGCVGFMDEFYDDAHVDEDPTPVSVSEGEDVDNIDFSLEMAGWISGLVTDSDGDPLEDCEVDAYPANGGIWGAATSGADGTYSIAELAPDEYTVRASCDGYASEYYDSVYSFGDATLVPVVGGQDTPGINFSLSLLGSISGTVEDSEGQPIEDAEVCAWEDDWDECDDTDEDGSYMIGGLIAGDYDVSAEADGYAEECYDGWHECEDTTPVSVVEGEDTPDIDFVLDAEPTPTPTQPAPTATVRHRREATKTPVPSATATSVPATPTTPVQAIPAAPISTPYGGAGPNIIAPLTGSGDGSGPTFWTYCAPAGALAVAATLVLAVAAGRRRHDESE